MGPLEPSQPDARDIGDSLIARGIKLSSGGSLYDPADPMGKMFFNILATFEFEVDLLMLRTREGMPGQTGKVTPISFSETVHGRRWMAVSWDRPLDSASVG